MTNILKDPAEHAAHLLDTGVPVNEIFRAVRECRYASYSYADAVERAAEQIAIDRLQVGDGVALRGYTDIEPATIIARTAKTMTVQHDAATPLHQMADLDPHPGGFACHFANQHAQRWDITPDPNGRIEKIFLTKKGWRRRGSTRNDVSAGRRKFHDYNF